MSKQKQTGDFSNKLILCQKCLEWGCLQVADLVDDGVTVSQKLHIKPQMIQGLPAHQTQIESKTLSFTRLTYFLTIKFWYTSPWSALLTKVSVPYCSYRYLQNLIHSIVDTKIFPSDPDPWIRIPELRILPGHFCGNWKNMLSNRYQ